MSCMLRASGVSFDVMAFLANCELEPVSVQLKGEPRFPKSQPNGPIFERSGVNFEASPADFSELKEQMKDTAEFLREHEALISRLKAFPGVENLTLDFGAEIHPPGWCSFHFPSDLLLSIGALGISLGLSVYPVEEENEPST